MTTIETHHPDGTPKNMPEPLDVEVIDSRHRVIYTYEARIGLLCTDNADAYEDEMGEPAPTVEAAMFMALRRDVEEYLGDDYRGNDD